MLLKESELDDLDIIQPILGKPYKEPGKLLTVTGSTIYFVKEANDLAGNPLPLKRDEMKAIFQRYEKGLMLFFTKSNYQNALLLDYESIEKISLKKGAEIIKKWFNPIMSFLLEIGMSLSKARYFGLGLGYQIQETVLTIKTKDYRIEMYTNGFSFESQVKYFNKLNLDKKSEIILSN